MGSSSSIKKSSLWWVNSYVVISLNWSRWLSSSTVLRETKISRTIHLLVEKNRHFNWSFGLSKSHEQLDWYIRQVSKSHPVDCCCRWFVQSRQVLGGRKSFSGLWRSTSTWNTTWRRHRFCSSLAGSWLCNVYCSYLTISGRCRKAKGWELATKGGGEVIWIHPPPPPRSVIIRQDT